MKFNNSFPCSTVRVLARTFLAICSLAGSILPTALLVASSASAVPPQPRAGEPLPDLTNAQVVRFAAGLVAYETPLSVAAGLGPALNQASCAACHETPVGGWGATRVTRFGNLTGGTFSFLESLGGPVLQRNAISTSCEEELPPASIANHVRDRVTPSVLAFGLVEAIPDDAILALEDATDANGDGISGRAHLVVPLEDPASPLRVGRFGWKAQVATVRTFSADAARNEMGLTNALLPTETAPNGDAALLDDCDDVPDIEDQPDAFGSTFVDRVTDFQRYLAPPPQSPRSGMSGESIFNAVGCAKCHVRQFTTSGSSALEPVLRAKTIRPYTDFLLHDMGALADGIPDGDALPTEMRTPPLWNLRTRPVLLHDGSANEPLFALRVESAILAHAGEGLASRNAYDALSAADKSKVIAFLDSLGRDDYDIDGDGLLTNLDYGIVVAQAGDLAVSPDEPWAVADLDQDGRIEGDEIDGLRALLGLPADCNQNGLADWSEIATGATTDANGNGVPDECDQSSCTARVRRASGTGGAIPDAGGGALSRSIAVTAPAGNPVIQSIRVSLDIEHTWASDLTITLRRGTDAPITLHSGCGTFHDLDGRYQLVDTAWEGAPAAPVTICQGTLVDNGGSNNETRFSFAPGTYRPAQGTASTAFQTIRGQSMAATWTLTITDSRASDVGTLLGWSLDFRYADPAPADCDGAGGPDCAQISADPSLDCDHDGAIDSCQPLAGDCDGDGVRDRCELAEGTATDCNANGVIDACEIAAGSVSDCNQNAVPDSCEIVDRPELDEDIDGILDECERRFGDLDLDGVVTAADLSTLLGAWGTAGTPFGDLDGDGVIGGADLSFLLSRWGMGSPWAPPRIDAVTPSTGSTAGGTVITITGGALGTTSAVQVGGVAAASFNIVSPNIVTAITPPGPPGVKAVSVVTVYGSSELPDAFTYNAPPTLLAISPGAGPTAGGTAITITGTNLTGTSSVTVGGNPATSVSVVNATTVTAVTPAGTAGAANVSLTTPYGSTTANGAFTYQLYGTPTISAVNPNSGPLAGGTAITITGTNLTGTSSVTIGGVAATSVSVVSATTVTAVTPAGTAGAKTVSVTTPGGTANLTNGFTYTSVWYTVLEQNPDPAIVTSATLRNAITATGYPWRVRDNGTNIEMVLIPPGTFNMGCAASNAWGCDGDESPVHSVTLTNAFYLGRYEVTQAQWQAKMGSNPSYFQSASAEVPAAQVPNRPVERVSWTTIQNFLTATGMRLPTEAEWEYAYRAGTTTAFHGFTGYLNGTNDDTVVGNIAWYDENSNSQTRPVGGKAANGFGLHDMSGNVWEWVNDWYESTYYASSPSTNPTGPAFGTHYWVQRGGSWDTYPTRWLRSSAREFGGSLGGWSDRVMGFRVARFPNPPTVATVSPNAGPLAGGTAITITGTNLTGTTSVSIGGVAATSVSVVNATTVTAVTPSGTVGAKDIVVTTPGGSATLSGSFTYLTYPSWGTVLENLPDPAIVTSATLRNAITATGYPWRVRDNGTNIEMVLIPPGTFNMGCSASNSYGCGSNESPVHAVTLTSAFYMGRYEVTQAQWTAKMGSNPSYWVARPENGNTANTNRPVEQVSWNQIAGTGGFLSGTGLRLPTEAEWEYAYRAGTTTAFHGFTGYPNGTNDDTLVGNIAWFFGNNGAWGTPTYGTKAVGQKAANSFGLHDMAGNVSEWVKDWYSGSYYASSPSTNPTGPASGTYRVLRGGAWYYLSDGVRSSWRGIDAPDGTLDVFGFRVARVPADPPAITSVSPNAGPTAGGTAITITGTNLTGASLVTIGGVAATSVSVVNATTVTAVTPSGTVGAKDIVVTTLGGSATLSGSFTYLTYPSWGTVLENLPDPAIVTSATLRNAITATGYPWRVRDNGTNIEMVLIPPGTFNMGCSASNSYGCDSSESPVHAVTLTSAFYMGRYEVTQAQWIARMGSNPSYFVARPENGNTANTNRPVEWVSWNQIAGTGGFLSGTGLRLPTEAEWEYAYRAGTTTAFHGFTGYLNGTNDDTLVGNIAWFSGNNGASGTTTYGTKAVGQKLANGFGLHDMSGNVWEWVNDRYSSSYYASSPSTNPPGPASGSNRVLRGGSWPNVTIGVRSSSRVSSSPDNSSSDLGFRVARAPL